MSEAEAIKNQIKHALKHISSEAVELYLGDNITELSSVPSPLVFHRDYVSRNKPVIIRGGVKQWPALDKWSNQYICDKLGDLEVNECNLLAIIRQFLPPGNSYYNS